MSNFAAVGRQSLPAAKLLVLGGSAVVGGLPSALFAGAAQRASERFAAAIVSSQPLSAPYASYAAVPFKSDAPDPSIPRTGCLPKIIDAGAARTQFPVAGRTAGELLFSRQFSSAPGGSEGAKDNEGKPMPEKHPGSPATWKDGEQNDYMLMHPVYSSEYVESVAPKHKKPQKIHEYVAYYAIQTCRWSFDKITGYGHDNMNVNKWMVRTIFLETVAGVPGMVAGMLRHMTSLRVMKRDHGWIHTLLEEAENERMHLMTFLQLKQPGPAFRTMVLLGQGVFFNAYMLLYILFPKTCHAAVGYLEEEAVKTYTHLIQDLDAGRIPEWKDKPAPPIAKSYWRLKDDATMRDVFLAIRADEACHSHVNHTFAELDATASNPFTTGSHMVP